MQFLSTLYCYQSRSLNWHWWTTCLPIVMKSGTNALYTRCSIGTCVTLPSSSCCECPQRWDKFEKNGMAVDGDPSFDKSLKYRHACSRSSPIANSSPKKRDLTVLFCSYFKYDFTCISITLNMVSFQHGFVLFLSSDRLLSHRRTFSIYLCPLSFWLTLPRGVLSRSWCCLSRPCVVFLACMHLALFLALSLSPGNSLVSSWCDHSMLVTLLWQCLTVPSFLQLCQEPT